MIEKIALPVNDSLQIVALDFCTRLFVAEIENGVILRRDVLEFNDSFPSLRAHRLKDLHIDTVLCGAVSDALSMTLWHCDVEVISGLAGEADRLVEDYVHSQLIRFHTPDFRPGFRRWRGRGGRRRFRGGRSGR